MFAKKFFLWFVCLISWNTHWGQVQLKGTVLNSETDEPLAFANIIFDKNPRLGVVTDMDGNFVFENQKMPQKLTISYMGFETLEMDIPSNQITIRLKPSALNLSEVVLNASDNPAHRIIRLVVENKDRNNPEKIASFQYKSYNKTVFDFVTKKDNQDSLKIRKALKGGHIMMMESVSERKFMQPNISEETVIATKVSGFKNPNFASLATDLQPFSFYQDHIPLVDIQYLNPIAKGSLSKYNFTLLEEYYQAQDTVFVIAYKPKKNKNFEGLTGILHVNSRNYAVQNVTATPFEKGKIDLKIQQKYQLINDENWFPEQLNYVMTITNFDDENFGIAVNGRSYISEVSLKLPLKKRDFALETVRMGENAAKKDSTFWVQYRPEVLKTSELKTYQFMDSIGEKVNFDRFLTWGAKLADNKFPLGWVDLDLSKTLVFNQYERARLGLGLFSNERLSDKFIVGGFAGYGLRDYQWKYGGSFDYHINKKNEIKLGYHYQNNLQEIGLSGMRSMQYNRLTIRDYIAAEINNIQQHAFSFKFRVFRNMQWHLRYQATKVTPLSFGDFESNIGHSPFGTYDVEELATHLRWAPKEKIVESFGKRMVVVSENPVFNFFYARGFEGNWGNLPYHKAEATIEQAFLSRNLGKTSYRLAGGWLDRNLPYGWMFTGEGSLNREFPYFMKYTFQTMQPYEFLSNRYAHLFLIHNFGTLLFKTSWVQPNISIHHNMGWSALAGEKPIIFHTFQEQKHVYLESGLQLDNLIKINYFNVGYLGFGASGFYRYGAYSLPKSSDNFAFKLTVNFTIK